MILRMKDRIQVIYLQSRRILWNGVTFQTKSALNLASHDYDLLLNAISVYLAVFTCKPFTKDENWKPTHPFGGVVLRKVKNFCSHFGSELNEMFHHKSKPRSEISFYLFI
jgi:hypothetical protein